MTLDCIKLTHNSSAHVCMNTTCMPASQAKDAHTVTHDSDVKHGLSLYVSPCLQNSGITLRILIKKKIKTTMDTKENETDGPFPTAFREGSFPFLEG